MFKKKEEKEINVSRLNELIGLSNNILKILFVLLIVVGVLVGIMLIKELKLAQIIFSILKIISPLFIGIFIAWLFDPLVTFLNKKGMRRGLSVTLCYLVIIGSITVVLSSLIPVLSTQINEFVTNGLPAVFDSAQGFINEVFNKLGNIQSLDANSLKIELFAKLEVFASNLTASLPGFIVSVLSACFSGIGIFILGLIVGFYLLLDFNNNIQNLYLFIPKKYRSGAKDFLGRVNRPLKRFINGSLIDMLLIFVICSIGFSIIGLKAPMLFALFCAITNVIPYAGPYIGGAPAVLVALTQSPTIGLAVLIFILIIQMLEGNLIQPFIMSKTTKLSPVTIILGLLVFGKFFGIFGMVISTPLLGVMKEMFLYFEEKYDLFRHHE